VEAGCAGQTVLDDIERHRDAVMNIGKYLQVLVGKPVEPGDQKEFTGSSIGIRATRGGFFTSLVGPGEFISEGQILGTISDAFGTIIEEIISPINGVVQIIHFPAAKHTGDPLYSLHKYADVMYV
jgi:hypothetical protein